MFNSIPLMTIEKYSETYHKENRFEIYNGVIQGLMPPVLGQAIVRQELAFSIYTFTQSTMDEVYISMPYIIVHEDRWVRSARTPDVLYFSAARWKAYQEAVPNWAWQVATLIPDMTAYVLPPNFSEIEISQKAQFLLQDGVKLVWMIDPWNKEVTAYHGSQITKLIEADTLSGLDVIPNFELPITQLFEGQ